MQTTIIKRPTYPIRRRRESRTERLAGFFRARPNVWIDGRELGPVAGVYAWRSRVADVRRQFHLVIENRQRMQNGAVVSEYRYVPEPRVMRPTSAPPQLSFLE